VSTDEQYPQHISIEFNQDEWAILGKYIVGENVEVGINLLGREWTDPQGLIKYFNSIQGWNIKKEATNDIP